MIQFIKKLFIHIWTFPDRFKRLKAADGDLKRMTRTEQYHARLVQQYKLIIWKESRLTAKNRRRVVADVERMVGNGTIKIRNSEIESGKDWKHCDKCSSKVACLLFGCAIKFNEEMKAKMEAEDDDDSDEPDFKMTNIS